MKKVGCVVILLFFWCSSVFAQGQSSDGTDFYIGWLYPSYNSQNVGSFGRDVLQFFGAYVLISSYSDNNRVQISYFDDKTGKEVLGPSVLVQKRRSQQVAIDRTKMRMTEPGEVAEWRSMHIIASNPVNVQFFSTGSNSGGSYLAISTPALGKNYI